MNIIFIEIFSILGLDRDKQVQQLSGVCEEENDLIQTVFTCHGNLDDPEFPQRFSHLLDQLSSLLSTGVPPYSFEKPFIYL